MVIRRRRLTLDVNEVSLQVSYRANDVLNSLKKEWESLYYVPGSDPMPQRPMSEFDFKEAFNCHLFHHYKPQYANQLCRWAFRLALREGYILQSDKQGDAAFYFAPICAVRTGRPRKKIKIEDDEADFED